ncbi:MAG: hypothetical protein M3R70_04145 [Actinomycetota bacterium]|nr:hypothetical protein [Actinomycetota bacterium]
MVALRALGGIAIALVFLLVNGGYVYRTKCPLPSGGTETNWTYGINDILPYIRSTSPPCKSHTGTRLGLSATGIWPIRANNFSASSTHVTQRDRAAADALATATAATSAEYEQERRQSAVISHEIRAHGGLTARLRRKYFGLFETSVAHLSTIKTALDGSARAKDAELAETQRVLSLWLAREIEIGRVFLTSTSKAEAQRRTNEVARKIAPLAHRLQALAPDVQAKYPNVNGWGFLPNA